MIEEILGVGLASMIFRNATDYPAEIRSLRRQMTGEDRKAFLNDYKHLPKETKTQFKQLLRDANMTEAGKLVNRDLSSYKPASSQELYGNGEYVDDSYIPPEQQKIDISPQLQRNKDFMARIESILNVPIPEIDPAQVVEAAKRYENISVLNQGNIVDKTRKILDVSQ